MAAAKAKSAPNGAAKKAKPSTPVPDVAPTPPTTNGDAASGASTPAVSVYGSGKPDKAVYEREQEDVKKQIDALQTKLSAVKDKLASASGKGGPSNDRRQALRTELDGLRGQQSTNKTSRGKVMDQLKALQENIQKKIKDLNAAKAKIPYKTVADVDERIKQLDKQVESGNLKLVDEKRALAEISQCKRNRRLVEGFQAEQESIEADRALADELRKHLDDPEAKAISERYDAIRAELDELKKESDEAYANRNKLLDERTELQEQLDALYNQKRESAQRFRDANDKHWHKVNEERAKRAERARAQRASEEEAKKKELVDRLREEAEMPAFQVQIEDCQTLVDYFSGKSSAQPASSTLETKSPVQGVPELELRKVEAPADMVVRKKKGADDEAYFVGGKSKKSKKGQSGPKAVNLSESNSGDGSTSSQTHLPLATLTALLAMSITPPTSSSEVPRVIEDLKTKKAWFEANQARQTAENKEKAEVQIRRILGSRTDASSEAPLAKPPNGGGEHPPEPAPTPAVVDVPSIAVPSDTVTEKLESVEEQLNGEEE